MHNSLRGTLHPYRTTERTNLLTFPNFPTVRTTALTLNFSLCPTLQLEEQRATQNPGRSTVRRRRGDRRRGKERNPRAESTKLTRLPGYHRLRGAAKRGSPSQARTRAPPREKILPVASNPGARRARYPGGRGGGENTGFVSRLPRSSSPSPPAPTADPNPGRI